MFKWFFDKTNKASGPVTILDYALAAIRWLLGPTVIAGLATTYDQYWQTYSYAGFAVAFVIAWLALALGVFLIGHGMAAWRGSETGNGSSAGPDLTAERDSLPDGLATALPRIAKLENQLDTLARNMISSTDGDRQRLERLISTLEKLSKRVDQIEGTVKPKTYGLLGSLGLKNQNPESRFDQLEDRIESNHEMLHKLLKEVRDKVEEQDENQEWLHAKVFEAFRAKEIEAEFDNVVGRLDELRKRLKFPAGLSSGDSFDWDDWQRDFEQWKLLLNEFGSVVEPYQNVTNQLFAIPHDRLKNSNWNFDNIPSLNDDRAHDLKVFYIQHDNVTAVLRVVTVIVKAKSKVATQLHQLPSAPEAKRRP